MVTRRIRTCGSKCEGDGMINFHLLNPFLTWKLSLIDLKLLWGMLVSKMKKLWHMISFLLQFRYRIFSPLHKAKLWYIAILLKRNSSCIQDSSLVGWVTILPVGGSQFKPSLGHWNLWLKINLKHGTNVVWNMARNWNISTNTQIVSSKRFRRELAWITFKRNNAKCSNTHNFKKLLPFHAKTWDFKIKQKLLVKDVFPCMAADSFRRFFNNKLLWKKTLF